MGKIIAWKKRANYVVRNFDETTNPCQNDGIQFLILNYKNY